MGSVCLTSSRQESYHTGWLVGLTVQGKAPALCWRLQLRTGWQHRKDFGQYMQEWLQDSDIVDIDLHNLGRQHFGVDLSSTTTAGLVFHNHSGIERRFAQSL